MSKPILDALNDIRRELGIDSVDGMMSKLMVGSPDINWDDPDARLMVELMCYFDCEHDDTAQG